MIMIMIIIIIIINAKLYLKWQVKKDNSKNQKKKASAFHFDGPKSAARAPQEQSKTPTHCPQECFPNPFFRSWLLKNDSFNFRSILARFVTDFRDLIRFRLTEGGVSLA